MSTLKQIVFASMLVGALLSTAAAQERASITVPQVSLTITANASGDWIRVTAPSSVVQMHLEVYAATGQKLFDQEIRGGNVFDWHLQDGQAQRLPAGEYVCVVTAKTVSGRLTQKIGAVTIAEKSARVRPGDSQQFTPPQAQAIGPVEADASWTVMTGDENQTTTVIANNGSEGQMIRGRGALSFRVGDFFRGTDQEQMRLTEEGNLGIGTAKPQFKLDVAGTIRAERVLIAKAQATVDNPNATAASQDSDNAQPLASGTGTQNRLAKWTDNAGTLGNSNIVEDANNLVGIGTINPGSRLHIAGAQGVIGAGTFQLDTNTLFSNFTSAWPAFEVLNTNQTNNNVSLFQFSDVASGAAHAGIGAVATNHTNKFGDLFFFTKGADGYQLRMGIYSGNVGIGTTSPAAKLDVAGNINTSSQYNIGGNRVLSTAGSNNFFAGVNTGTANTGSQNAFVGKDAGAANQDGGNNNFFGFRAGLLHITGGNNSFFGSFSGAADNNGGNNSFFGEGSGSVQTSGTGNSFFGFHAGNSNANGSNNTTVGADADVGSGSLSFATAIGAGTVVSANDTIALGRSNGSDRIGIGTGAPSAKVHIVDNGGHILLGGVGCASGFTGIAFGTTSPDCTNYSLLGDGTQTIVNSLSQINFRINNADKMTLFGDGRLRAFGDLEADTFRFDTNLNLGDSVLCYKFSSIGTYVIQGCGSSIRLKKNVNSFISGLSLINRLRPVTFDWKSDDKHDLGLIAEEVDAVEPLLVTRDNKGQAAGVKYEKLPVVLINAIKEQQAQIEQQEQQIKEQRTQLAQQQAQLTQQQRQFASLKKVVCRSRTKARVCK